MYKRKQMEEGELAVEMNSTGMKEVVFELHNVDPSLPNALRRVMIAEVPTLAIDTVKVLHNTSIFHDEYLVHRLGLIPFESETAHQMRYLRDCDCEEGCDSCTYTFELNVKCKAGENRWEVTPDKLVPKNIGASGLIEGQNVIPKPVSSDDYDKLVICPLTSGQEFCAECEVRKGIGKLHSKWQPVCQAYFSFKPEVTLRQDLLDKLTPSQKREFAKCCPVKVFKYDEQTGMVDVKNKDACMYCNDCLVKAEDLEVDDCVKISTEKGKNGTSNFLFTVEATGHMPAHNVVLRSVEILKDKLQRLSIELEAFREGEDITQSGMVDPFREEEEPPML